MHLQISSSGREYQIHFHLYLNLFYIFFPVRIDLAWALPAIIMFLIWHSLSYSWDIMARFGPMHKDLPPAFFADFSKMALDESKHLYAPDLILRIWHLMIQFSSLLRARLIAFSTPYGSLPIHASLWDSATLTSRSLLSRLAIIHLVHEARGLDVNPKTIEKFRKAGDKESVDVLEVIHADEVTHVTAGHRWFVWMCEQQQLRQGGLEVNPVQAFREEVRRCWHGDIKGPFNVEDREKAGLSREFYDDLKGEMSYTDHEENARMTINKTTKSAEISPEETQVEQKQGNTEGPIYTDGIQKALAAVQVTYETWVNESNVAAQSTSYFSAFYKMKIYIRL